MNPESFAARRQKIDTSFGNIAVYERGEGPTALFVHGYPLSAYFWRHQLEGLADVRRCVAVDLMGLGYSEPKANVRIAYDEQAHMLAEVARVLELGAVDLVGNDSGGSIAQIFATTAPESVRSLTLTNCEVAENYLPAPLAPLVDMAKAGALPGIFESLLGDLDAARSGMAAVFARPETAITPERMAYDIAPLVSSPRRKAWLAEYLVRLDPELNLGVVPALEKFDRPVLVVWGNADEYMPIEWAHWLKEHVPGVRRVVEVPGGRLFFPEEEPELLNRELRAFWEKEA